ncbi:MadC family VWA domain-containing protein [Gordonia sputi]|uniref:MadC family VWA domain-containing protein n=1 Tax=Gordonia sputi TaxID=36823 RepID=UPI003FD76284
MTTSRERSGARTRDRVLDALSVMFGHLLRGHQVTVSPAEVIEIRRTLALVGADDLDRLRAALRAVSVKYAHEADGFEIAFDLVFVGVPHRDTVTDLPRPRGTAAELPDDIAWDDEFDGAARRIGADEHTDEIGELMADDPDARERHGESAHREENDFSVSAGTEQLAVDSDSNTVAGGITYTVEIDGAAAAKAGELVGSTARVSGTSLSMADAAAILAALDAADARSAYGDDGADNLTDEQREELEHALSQFISALSERLAATPVITGPDTDPVHGTDQAQIDRACHRLVQRIRGAPRTVVRAADRGSLDMRRTMRCAVRTDGVPLTLWRRNRTPGPVRLLVLVDVSLSVRPVAGFILRLAQTLYEFGDHCEVVAFVDRPVLVTTALRTAAADDALTAVLATDDLDLSATSDYGRMLTELLEIHRGLITPRTSVLVVGDARSNGFDPRVDLFAELARRVHRVAWLTPEPRRYWTQTGCALDEYSLHCSGAVSARDGTELIEKVDELGSALA